MEQVSNEQLNDENILSDTSDVRKPWQMLIENSFIHYEEHIVGLKHWLKTHELET